MMLLLVKGESKHEKTQGRVGLSYCSIPIHERVELPESLIPADSRVEIDAKITAGICPLLAI
jgi:hypothetical protein